MYTYTLLSWRFMYIIIIIICASLSPLCLHHYLYIIVIISIIICASLSSLSIHHDITICTSLYVHNYYHYVHYLLHSISLFVRIITNENTTYIYVYSDIYIYIVIYIYIAEYYQETIVILSIS